MSDFDEFESYYALSDRLIETMSPEELADCLRMLALHSPNTDRAWETSHDKTCSICSERLKSVTTKRTS